MALIDKTSIGTGNTIQAEHITRIIDALNESGSYEIIATGSFTGSFKGNGSGLTGVTVTTAQTASYVLGSKVSGAVALATTASYAVSASYEINYETSSSYADTSISASHSVIADTASYINVSNIAGEIIATTASYVTTAQTASYVTASNVIGTVSNAVSSSYALTASYIATAQTASYVSGSNVSGAVALATTANYATTSNTANTLSNITRAIYTIQTTDATPTDGAYWHIGFSRSRYIKAIVQGWDTSNDTGLAGEFTKLYAINFMGMAGTLNSAGTLYDNMTGTPAFSLSSDRFTVTGIAGATINWRVIIERTDY